MGWIKDGLDWFAEKITKPLTDIKGELAEIRKENAEQSKQIAAIDSDTADLLCSQLTREHEYYLRQGWCSAADKRRLADIYERYKSRGRNHLADHYMTDINVLDEHPAIEVVSTT